MSPIRNLTTGLLFLSTAAIALSGAANLAAQTRLEPGETRVSRGVSEEGASEASTSGENGGEGAEQGEGEESPPRPGIEKFEDVEVKRVRPGVLPPPSASETDIPAVIRNGSGNLPTPPSREDLEEMARDVRARVFELVSLQPSRGPGGGTPVVRRGHAVLVSGAEGPPILLTTYFWLERAEKLYLAPEGLSEGDEDRDTPTAERRSVEEMTVDGRSDRWLEAHRDELIRAHLYRPDEHRNLATVLPADPSKLDLPDRGLELFDTEKSSPVRLYGYSPRSDAGLQQTKLLASHPDKQSLVYYLQTPYTHPFGAPIVTTSGKLLVVTAFQHPKDPDIVLAIPPAPVAAYVGDVLSTLD